VRAFGLPLLFALICAAAAAADTTPHLTLGVLRADGLMIPFASYDGRWSVPWPVSLRYVTIPIGLNDVNSKWWGAAGAAAPWRAVLQDGAKRPLTLQALRQVHVFCTTRLGVQTDYRGAPPSPGEPTVPKDGLGIAGEATVPPIERVSKDSTDWKATARMIVDDFNDAEKTAASGFSNWKHPFKPEQRGRYAIQLEALYRSNEQTHRGAWRVSYVEAVRSFPARPDDKGCGLITYAYGWIIERQGKRPRIELRARVTYCDREGVSFLQPLGRLVLRDDVYWVTQMSSWRDEVYTVSRIRPDGVQPVVVAEGGNCPRS
jgi:hypothetical protein